MRIGTALFTIAAGLILTYAVDVDVPGLNVQALGTIGFLVGGLGLVVAVYVEVVGSASHRPRAPKPAAAHPSPRRPAAQRVLPSTPAEPARQRPFDPVIEPDALEEGEVSELLRRAARDDRPRR